MVANRRAFERGSFFDIFGNGRGAPGRRHDIALSLRAQVDARLAEWLNCEEGLPPSGVMVTVGDGEWLLRTLLAAELAGGGVRVQFFAPLLGSRAGTGHLREVALAQPAIRFDRGAANFHWREARRGRFYNTVEDAVTGGSAQVVFLSDFADLAELEVALLVPRLQQLIDLTHTHQVTLIAGGRTGLLETLPADVKERMTVAQTLRLSSAHAFDPQKPLFSAHNLVSGGELRLRYDQLTREIALI